MRLQPSIFSLWVVLLIVTYYYLNWLNLHPFKTRKYQPSTSLLSDWPFFLALYCWAAYWRPNGSFQKPGLSKVTPLIETRMLSDFINFTGAWRPAVLHILCTSDILNKRRTRLRLEETRVTMWTPCIYQLDVCSAAPTLLNGNTLYATTWH